MNQQDRQQVTDLVSQLEALQSQFDTIKEQIQALAEAEQEKFDNLNEGLQQSTMGQQIEECAGNLDEAANAESIQEAIDALGNLN